MFVRRSSVGFAPIFGSVVNVRELRALILSCPLFVLSPLELGGIITSCRTPATTLLYRLPWRSRRDLTFLFFSNTLRACTCQQMPGHPHCSGNLDTGCIVIS